MAAQQSDNVAHALSGAGGGILSMALTYQTPILLRISKVNNLKLSSYYAFYARTSRIKTR